VVKPNLASRVMCRRASSEGGFLFEVFRFFFGVAFPRKGH
jgi:hypothetical protein